MTCYFICQTGLVLAMLPPDLVGLGLTLSLPWVGSHLLWPGEVPLCLPPPPSEPN